MFYRCVGVGECEKGQYDNSRLLKVKSLSVAREYEAIFKRLENVGFWRCEVLIGVVFV